MQPFTTRLLGIIFLCVIASSDLDAGKPHCFTDIICSDGRGSSFTNNTRWAKRTNGKRWFQQNGNHRSECNAYETLTIQPVAEHPTP